MTATTVPDTIPLFLYGTLREGGGSHGLVTPYLVSSRPARVWGRLYLLPAGYPALEVPPEGVLAEGSPDPIADTVISEAIGQVAPRQTPGDWGWVYGDVVTLRDPARSVPPLDGYEDFRPGQGGLYRRVLVVVDAGEFAQAAWTYTKQRAPGDRRLTDGIWRPDTLQQD